MKSWHPEKKVQMKFRLSENLRQQIEQSAAQNRRSMNSEMIAVLEQAYSRNWKKRLLAKWCAT